MTDFTITLPECSRHKAPENKITTKGPLVIVGANGAGKSRLAAWLEKQQLSLCHRVSAQRTLSFPDDFRGTTIEKAEGSFLYGHESFTAKNVHNKFGHRWGGQHDQLLDDFQRLVTLLFSEGAQVREEYVRRMSKFTSYEKPPVRKLDVIQRIWEQVLPNREMLIGGHKIEARKRGAEGYFSGHEMSDGERVIFYLIGQCLCAPKNGVILLDEPELHLHRALQTRLWDAVEAERPDCLFVYITHDLDFAASRKGGSHIWLSEYSGSDKWEWDLVPSGVALPEALLLEVLGSRKPILFVEGKAGGSDERVYRMLYPNHHVVAFGGCEQIIHATASCRTLRAHGQLHVEAFGLIDRDGRNEADVASLSSIGVAVLEWAEIENLLLIEEVLQHIAQALHRDADKNITEAKTRVIETLAQDSERIACELAGRELDRTIRGWAWKHPDGATLETSLSRHIGTINASATLGVWRKQIHDIVTNSDYPSALRIYPNKGLLGKVSQIFGLSKYADYVLRRIGSPEGTALVAILQKFVPTL
ncbi:MAG: AAA family ATPase [Opitutaceae bacterium]